MLGTQDWLPRLRVPPNAENRAHAGPVSLERVDVDAFRKLADEKKAAPVFLQGRAWELRFEDETVSAIEDVEQCLTVDAAQLHVNRTLRVADDVPDEFGVDQLRGEPVERCVAALARERREVRGAFAKCVFGFIGVDVPHCVGAYPDMKRTYRIISFL